MKLTVVLNSSEFILVDSRCASTKGATSDAGSISSELIMGRGGVRSILLLSLVARCL